MEAINIIEKLAAKSKMDCWLGVTENGKFKDLENGNKPLSAKSAMHDLIDGMTDEDFNTLNDEEKFEFVRYLGSLLK